ncbi:hypothetical protein MMC22_006030, partial [Lobaria immixta]|nr:hypothetical protein [Lobaria immixta]
MRPDFEACGKEFFSHSSDIYSKYVYNGSVHGILQASRPVLITVEGCRALCGTGTAYYAWKDCSNTITTWVLPIIGLLVQAPFESNQAWRTILALCRWIGSPISTLSYILWNIKVTGKCALMMDMACKYDEFPEQGSEFSQMRDSLFILCVMNQYSPKPSLPPIEAERLLRLALFSNMLSLDGSTESKQSLVKRRTEMAQNFREGRKKGVIPVFVSFLWFVFALGLSIQIAFGDIGANETAHNLAVGLLVGWLPILILASTVDRNLVSADAIREKLNRLVDDVRLALLDPPTVRAYMAATRSTEEDFAWTRCLRNDIFSQGDFFKGFGGQGRTHWHYGVAHPLLAGIETKFMADYGRDWLHHAYAARLAIVVGSRNVNGLKMFDPRMVWQITSSIIIVCGSLGGGFILSYNTPTVGLGCRSGGYLIYGVIALSLLTTELFVWWLTHHTTHTPEDILAQVGTKLEDRLARVKGGMGEATQKSRRAHTILSWFRSKTFRWVMKNFFIRPCEVGNTVWLAYIVFAQTFGSYQTCDCMASTWGRIGGYLDFQLAEYYTAHGVYLYWGVATALSLTVMTAGLVYIAIEYCTQSHLSTERYDQAMIGLRHTRCFMKYTYYIRAVRTFILEKGKLLWWKVNGGRSRRGRRSL